MTRSSLKVGVLLGDPKLPYSFSHEGRLTQEELVAFRDLEQALDTLEGYTFTYFSDHERLIDDLRTADFDLALNFCDTGYRNDWYKSSHIAALLEIFDIPFTGSGLMALDMTSDKSLVRAFALSLGIPVPVEQFADLRAETLTLPERYPAVIKPNVGGGSFGMTPDSVVHDAQQAEAYMRWLAERIEPPDAVIQEFLTGPEYTVGVLGSRESGLKVLVPAEIDFSELDPELPAIYTYDAKFDPESPYWKQLVHQPAELDKADTARLSDYATLLFQRLQLRDYARFDFRAGADGKIRMLDVNPNPTWYADSRMAMMASWAGYSYADMLRMILESAVARYGL